MWESVAGPVVSMVAAATLIAPTPTPTPGPPVDATPVLTTAPFGALPGQQVTHTITISGTAALTAAVITLTTTADLDSITARAEPGRCTVSARTVVCELGDVRLAAGGTAPRVTITGRISPGEPRGALVRNRVTLTAAQFAGGSAQVASNAYLIPGADPTILESPGQTEAAVTIVPPHRRSMAAPAVAVLVAGAIAVGALLLARRRRRPGGT
ncbi:hypothetical protein Q2K19_24830 [Micromonospora soli]|uniref:hypothetical protein n=1 Tax=Micromonospora sp. NBRC 110009 TaxID=3061627 RepID=UPI002672ABDC|nr:hypothetical protein [Micromonospora sp. NBRC 110009]WKT97375.1 hypothetical protein Q2K19_24830 [Micromonospora sp. NBRC 110009]